MDCRRAKAESQAESINEEGGQADTETEAPVPEPEAPRAPALEPASSH